MNRPVPASQRVAAIFAATILLERLRRERPREETARLCSDSTFGGARHYCHFVRQSAHNSPLLLIRLPVTAETCIIVNCVARLEISIYAPWFVSW